ncbi:UvrD-helicase domain-containing protein [Chitinophaga filiformis]|uniref:UvrD-helicase domain-containing protein n=1 Tax=Chitinophaga filiformis TaxID=104663 RepID=UPI00397BC820
MFGKKLKTLEITDRQSVKKIAYLFYPQILPILRERFQYVFVDEMQDMSANQFQLLETLFATTNYSIKKYRFCFYHRTYLSATQSIHKRIN